MSETVRLERDGAVAHLVLARPERHNALDLAMAKSLCAALESCAADPALRVLLIRAEGPSFCVGGDLGHVGSDPAELERIAAAMVEPAQDLVARLDELPIPVVCAAAGPAAGLGLGLLWASDLVIGADDLTLMTAFAAVGVSGDGGSTYFLPRLVGQRRALELMLLNRRVTAQEALAWGLVTRLVARDALLDEASAVARDLAAGATLALGRMRRLVREAAGPSLREHLAAERVGVLGCAATHDMREGLLAFAERRRPDFRGT